MTEYTISVPGDIDQWYHNTFFRVKVHWRLLGALFGTSLRDPKIFATLKPNDTYRFVALDGWRRTMWHESGLSRRTREAIAVAVSTANNCHY